MNLLTLCELKAPKRGPRLAAMSFLGRSLLLGSIIFLAGVSSIGADEKRDHHELSETQLGAVHFPISCLPAVQKPFERGVALLHSFAFETAEQVFPFDARRVQEAIEKEGVGQVSKPAEDYKPLILILGVRGCHCEPNVYEGEPLSKQNAFESHHRVISLTGATWTCSRITGHVVLERFHISHATNCLSRVPSGLS